MVQAMFNTYTDPISYRRAATGLETDSLVGNVVRLTSDIAIGATTLPVSALTTALAVMDQVTIFDGSNSETVFVTAAAAIGDTSIATTATLAAHAMTTIVCSDGVRGSLADIITRASSWLEVITQQPRWLTSMTETLQAPSMRAAVDKNFALILRPRRFPLGDVTALSYQSQASNVVDLDPAQCIIDSQVQTVAVPSVTMLGAQQSLFFRMPVGRSSPIWVTLTYDAGYSQLPGYISEACDCLVGALLSDRDNPTGAAELQLGKRHLVAYLRGDLSGKTALVKRAEDLLRGDIERPM
jgi:hypothetical protein